MKLYAISDLHLANRGTCLALDALPVFPEDWLILAGDVGESDDHLKYALYILTRRFKQVIWAPGNHDLWTLPTQPDGLRGEARYRAQVDVCRQYGVLTPEDPYPTWHGEEREYVLVPMFLLYDYSFRPAHVPEDQAVTWAAESGVVCTDEELLHTEPFASVSSWCKQRCDYTEERLKQISPDASLVLINHFPLRRKMAQLIRFPRFSLWCGTLRTEDWHTQFPVSVVVYGHMHIRDTQYVDGVRFEEVSLGYPRDWDQTKGVAHYLRQILPLPEPKKDNRDKG